MYGGIFDMKKIIIIFLLPLSCFAEEYTVVKGDCLWNIAKSFYNNPFLWKEIYKANKQKIKNPDLIYPGQVFILPEIDTHSDGVTEEVTTVETPQEVQELSQHEINVSSEGYKEDEQKGKVDIIKENVEKEKYVYKEEFIKTIKLKDFKISGKIISAEKKKFVYIDFDKVYCQLNEDIDVTEGEVLGVYHLGPSKYDINLMKVPKDQLTLVGKIKIIKVLENKKILCEIIRAYSPIVINDFVSTR